MPTYTEGGTRTLTPLRELDFESSASANSATSADGVIVGRSLDLQSIPDVKR